MRVVTPAVILISTFIVSACAPYKPDPNAESVSYDSRIRTGSNIPRKGTATTVDKAVLDEQLDRQGGTIQR